MNYNENSICPICNAKTIVTIQAHGDYDGPNCARETDPLHCGTCKGIQLANPEMWKMLHNLYVKLCTEKENSKKKLRDLEQSLYTLTDIYKPLHSHERLKLTMFKLFKKRFDHYAKIHKEVDGNAASLKDEWVVGNATVDVVKSFVWAVEKRKEEVKYPY